MNFPSQQHLFWWRVHQLEGWAIIPTSSNQSPTIQKSNQFLMDKIKSHPTLYIFYIYTYIWSHIYFCFMPTLMTTGLSKNLCKTWWSMIQESFIPFPQPMSQIRFLFSDLEKVTNHTFSVLILWYLVIFICIHLDHTTNTLDPIISSFLNLSSLTFFHHAGLHLQSINSSC